MLMSLSLSLLAGHKLRVYVGSDHKAFDIPRALLRARCPHLENIRTRDDPATAVVVLGEEVHRADAFDRFEQFLYHGDYQHEGGTTNIDRCFIDAHVYNLAISLYVPKLQEIAASDMNKVMKRMADNQESFGIKETFLTLAKLVYDHTPSYIGEPARDDEGFRKIKADCQKSLENEPDSLSKTLELFWPAASEYFKHTSDDAEEEKDGNSDMTDPEYVDDYTSDDEAKLVLAKTRDSMRTAIAKWASKDVNTLLFDLDEYPELVEDMIFEAGRVDDVEGEDEELDEEDDEEDDEEEDEAL